MPKVLLTYISAFGFWAEFCLTTGDSLIVRYLLFRISKRFLNINESNLPPNVFIDKRGCHHHFTNRKGKAGKVGKAKAKQAKQ